MEVFSLSDAQKRVALRALKAVAMSDGEFESHEVSLLDAAARVLGVDSSPEEIDSATPEEAAEAFEDAQSRTRLVQAQLIMAMMDGDVGDEELKTIKAYAKALGVDEPRLKNLKQYMGGHITLIKLDLQRKSQMIDDVFREAWRRAGLRGVWKTAAPFKGLGGRDTEQMWRFRQLGLLPEDTFGHAYWSHMTQRKFSFPGEHRAFPELLAKHDLCHVLGGYDTDPQGECEVIAFIAGFMEADPFWYLFAITMHMHLGVQVFGDDPTARFAFEPHRVLKALERGMQVNADLYDTGWDFWPLFDKPLADVRRQYNIPPA